MNAYEQHKKKLMNGWQTWNSRSVLSHIMMPECIGINLGLKDYKEPGLLEEALIGSNVVSGRNRDIEAQPHAMQQAAAITPYAHAYDNSFTELKLEWFDNILNIKTALDGDDLVMLVTPIKQPKKPSSLLVNGVSLWNKGGIITKKGDVLYLESGSKNIPVYLTEPDNGELFTYATTPYLSASLCCPIGISTGKRRTISEIETIIKVQQKKWEDNKNKYGKHAEAYNAMQTCQAWDTVYNPESDAPITTVSRIWNNNWGGYVLFCWDTYFAALMQSIDNKDLAYCNAIEITHAHTDRGFVPNYAAQNNFKSFDRSQPPVGSMVCLMMYNKFKEKWFLEEVYNDLVVWNQWFIDNRSTKHGLMAWGSDPYEGTTGHNLEENYGVHERFGGALESGMDNTPMYDDTPFDKERNILLLEDVGLVGLYINDCHCLAEIAKILGHDDKASELEERASKLEDNMENVLWDEKFGMYLNRREDTGAFEYRLSPYHFHALFSHKVSEEHARRIMDEHFYNPEEFWGEYIIPSIARNDPSFPKQTYWQGRIWAPHNLLVYLAMERYPFEDAKQALAEKSEKLILKEWLEHGHVHENYDPDNGEGCNNPRSDPFYHWGGLLSFIALYQDGWYDKK